MVTVVDNTILSALEKCEAATAVRFVLGWQVVEESPVLAAGTAVHRVLEAWMRGAPTPLDHLDAYATAFQDRLPVEDRLHPTNITYILTEWLKRNSASAFPFTAVSPHWIEVRFRLPLVRGIYYVGTIDAVVGDADGVWSVLEHKTTSSLGQAMRRYTADSQVTSYLWAVRHYSDKPLFGGIYNIIQLTKVPEVTYNKDGSIRKCREHHLPVDQCRSEHVKSRVVLSPRSEAQFYTWKANAVDAAKRFRTLQRTVRSLSDVPSMRHQGMFNGACQYCSLLLHCRGGWQSAAGLVYQPWDPEGGHRGDSSG